MMKKIHDNLFIGNKLDCFYDDRKNWVVIHACKTPCHQKAIGYKGNLNRKHSNYLFLKEEKHLYLNMVDMNKMLSHKYTEPIINITLDFIESRINSNKVLIHCNLGRSRAPSLAMLFLAKRQNVIPNKNYQDAKKQFIELYPKYLPGLGIESYLTKYWEKLN